ncbi:MAG: hypothetical protein HYU66_07990 [Armatimonadetes bacterium]|nr:hypothetical protein [Armatimonadota bacterium]
MRKVTHEEFLRVVEQVKRDQEQTGLRRCAIECRNWWFRLSLSNPMAEALLVALSATAPVPISALFLPTHLAGPALMYVWPICFALVFAPRYGRHVDFLRDVEAQQQQGRE